MTQTPSQDARHAADPVPAGGGAASILPWADGAATDAQVGAPPAAEAFTRARRPSAGASAAPGTGADPGGGAPPGTDAVSDDADADLFEEGWTAPKRASRLTLLLAAGVIAALAFAGGAYAQRQHDQGLTSSAGTGRTGGFGGAFAGGQLPSGFPSGGFAGAGSGAGGSAGSSASAAAGAGAGGSGAADVPVVVGTIAAIDATTITVKNFGGQSVVVHVPATASVTAVGLGGLKVGATVSVIGTKAADGSVTATAVVSRKAG